MGWLRPMWVWPCLLGSTAPSSLETQRGAQDCCFLLSACQRRTSVLPSLEENSLSLWVCCGSNKLPLFLLTPKRYRKQQSGQVTASWEESHKSEHNGGKRQLYALGPIPVCAPFETHTLTQTHTSRQAYTHTRARAHTHTRTLAHMRARTL